MWSLAIKTLLADRGKLLMALLGVIFSIVLMNVQGGLFIGLIQKASMLVDQGQADIWVGHRDMHNVDFPRDVPRRWVDRIRATPGVVRAEPYVIGFTDMTLPSGGFEGTTVVGVDRASLLGNAWNITRGDASNLYENDGIIIDDCDDDKLEYPQVGEVRELGGKKARVVAKSYGITGFLVTPYVFTTLERAQRYLQKPPSTCSYFLVQVDSTADVQQVCNAISDRLPEVTVLTRRQYSAVSINYWLTRTGLGISFGAAALLGLIIGLVIVGQTLYALVLDRLPEFGTLKAIGARDSQIYTILFLQAMLLAVLGSILGLAAVFAVKQFLSNPRAPIDVPYWLSLGSFGLVLMICLLSSLLPYLKIRQVDPLSALQG